MRDGPFALAGLVLALAGCAPLATFTGHGTCSPGQCKISVKVDGDCRITAIPEHLDVPSGGQVHHILWSIDPPTAPYVFDANGISFRPGENPGQFDEKEPRGNGKQFHWRDKNSQAGSFKYDINVRDPGGRLCHLDPFIHNH